MSVETVITSANTSINSHKIPAVFKHPLVIWKAGTKNLDWGGGKYDTATEYLAQLGVQNYIYDPYNRSEEHNKAVLAKAPYDSATISNVLNVVPSAADRIKIIKDVLDNIKEESIIYVKVYEGNGSGNGKITKKACWQENRKIKSYAEELAQFKPQLNKGIIIIKKINKEREDK